RPLAATAVRGAARIRAHAADRRACPGLASGRRRQINHDGHGQGLARLRTALYSPAASFLAQLRLAQEKSMVRGRVASPFAPARAACLALLGLLAACAPQVAQQGLETAKPAIERDAFRTHDGLELPLRHWDAPAPIAVIVALHGMSDYSNAFDMPAT